MKNKLNQRKEQPEQWIHKEMMIWTERFACGF